MVRIPRPALAFGVLLALGATSCMRSTRGNGAGDSGNSHDNGGNGAVQPDTETVVYRAELASLNDSVTGRTVMGTATARHRGDSLFLEVMASGLEPGIMHLQHLHGFPGNQDAACADIDQDVNGDSIIDLIETHVVAGITLVPFNADPASLDLSVQGYPEANNQGAIVYKDTVLVSELQKGLREKYGIDSLMLDKRVITIHGVSPDSTLPPSVQSLPDAPAHTTLPVGCGKFRRDRGGLLPF